MYSNKTNINILTSLLAAHGVRRAVVCPGSRNAPIAHNLDESSHIECFPVTDERSAGFCALGMAQATGEPVAVCVTSGTALLNLLPAVAEAFYQHLPLVVVSADRPPQWIDQLDGQTLPQPGALGQFVRCAVTLPEPTDAEQRWHCNRLVNEALLACRHHLDAPVHINVPISEPLFEFTEPSLPAERVIRREEMPRDGVPATLSDALSSASRVMIVVGQTRRQAIPAALCRQLHERGYVVLQESLSAADAEFGCLDEAVVMAGEAPQYVPELILYVGDTLVSKRARQYMRRSRAVCWEVTAEGAPHDVFMNLQGIVEAIPSRLLSQLPPLASSVYRDLWTSLRSEAARRKAAFCPPPSQMMAVKELERRIGHADVLVHYANSMAVRLASVYARHYVFCNRGVNGIEGSLSSAVGASLVSSRKVFCVIGDLSFFYDQNALWNQSLHGNLRILLLNNHGGGIFRKFEGLNGSTARDRLVCASHQTSAEGICRDNSIHYYSCRDEASLADALDALVDGVFSRPVLVEVLTDAETDAEVMRQYIEQFIKTQ